VGCAASVWYNIVETGVGANVLIHRDGSVEIQSAVQDIGGGIRTVLAQVVAEVLGLQTSQITVRIGDSQWPVGPGSGGSKTTASLAPAAHRAAEIAAQKLAALAPELGPTHAVRFEGAHLVGATDSLPFAAVCGRMREASLMGYGERGDDLAGLNQSDREELRHLARTIAGVQMAEVQVDTETGVVRVLRVLAIQDCGRVMNPLAARSQMNGGIIQGISYALYEDRVLDPNTGRMLNPNLESYRITGVSEVPELDVVLMNVHSGLNSTGAMGLGEPATVPTAAAVANAVAHALGGKRVRSLPITPEKVLGL
jgi:xanthine dehydrogenase YagR molybdenum-binding subunit